MPFAITAQHGCKSFLTLSSVLFLSFFVCNISLACLSAHCHLFSIVSYSLHLLLLLNSCVCSVCVVFCSGFEPNPHTSFSLAYMARSIAHTTALHVYVSVLFISSTVVFLIDKVLFSLKSTVYIYSIHQHLCLLLFFFTFSVVFFFC